MTPGLLDLSALWSLVALDRPELKHEPWVPVTQPRLADGDGRARPVRGAPGRRRPGPPPLRLVLLLGRGLRRAGRPRSRRPRDQADDVPHLDAGEPDHPRVDPRRGARQAGGGAGRAQGPVRRGGQHHVRPRARAGGRARRVRGRRAEDAREDLARRATRGRRRPPVRPRRHRQLQPGHRSAVRGHRAPDGRPRDRGRSHRPVQPADRVQPAARVPPAAGGPGVPASGDAGADPRPGPGGRPDRAEDERARRPRHGRRAVRGVPGGCRDRPDRPRDLLPAPGDPRPVRADHRPLARRPVPRALADLPVRRARRRPPTTSVRPT